LRVHTSPPKGKPSDSEFLARCDPAYPSGPHSFFFKWLLKLIHSFGTSVELLLKVIGCYLVRGLQLGYTVQVIFEIGPELR
jgi:hypothetical protein